MPRLTNSATGVVVNVDDATAARLGAEWAAAEKSKPKAPPKKAAASKSSKSE